MFTILLANYKTVLQMSCSGGILGYLKLGRTPEAIIIGTYASIALAIVAVSVGIYIKKRKA